MRSSGRKWQWAMAVPLVVALVGCNEEGVAPPTASEIVLTPDSVGLEEADTALVRATVRYSDGTEVLSPLVEWTSDDTIVVRIVSEPSGNEVVLRALRAGDAEVRATSMGASATVKVHVVPVLESLNAVAGTGQLGEPDQLLPDTLVAQVLSLGGAPVPGLAVEWSVLSGGGSLTVLSDVTDAQGEVKALWRMGEADDQEAEAKIVTTDLTDEMPSKYADFTAQLRQDVAGIVISPDSAMIAEGEAVQLEAEAVDDSGNVVEGVDITWSSGDTIIARVDPNGKVVGRSPGQVPIIASAGRFADTARITVADTTAVPVSLVLTPDSVLLGPGATQQFTARVEFNDGTLRPAAVQWTAMGGTISDSGLYTAGQTEGTFPVMAIDSASGLRATAVVVIGQEHRTVTAVHVTPTTATVFVGQTQQFEATNEQTGGVIQPASVVWSATGGPITQTGLYTAGSVPGTYFVAANDTLHGLADTATVSIESPTLESVVVLPQSITLDPDQSTTFEATGYFTDGSDRPITVNWSATGGTITSEGVYTAGSTRGTFRVVGREPASGLADTASVVIDGVTGGTVVSLSVFRMDGGSGSALVSNGIPLPPGLLMPGQTAQVSLTVNGVEQSLYVEALNSFYPDGSIRSLLVQFRTSVDTITPLPARLHVGVARKTADRTRVEPTGTPQAAALPTDVNYILSTDIVGPSYSSERTRGLSASWMAWEQDFVQYADYHWDKSGPVWDDDYGDYYDRAKIYFAFWARTAFPEYWRRATLQAVDYREGYLAANNWTPTPRWSLLLGIEMHYLLTGQTRSRIAVLNSATNLVDTWSPHIGNPDYQWMENRAQARVLLADLLAWRLNGTGRDWAAQARSDLDKILGTQQSDGSYRFYNTCYQSWNFMMGMLNQSYIDYYRWFEADSRIPGAVKRAVDYLWSTQWDPATQSFFYNSGTCGNISPYPAPDLNNMIVNGFAWTYSRTGNSTYRTEANAIFNSGVQNSYLAGGKQFNEQYTYSYHAMVYLYP